MPSGHTPVSRIADRIVQASRAFQSRGETRGLGGIGGEILGGLLGGGKKF